MKNRYIVLTTILLVFVCVVLLPSAQAIPEPELLEGGAPGWNTALGQIALPNTSGTFNTALGAGTLHTNTTGGSNTAVGLNALRLNTTGGANTAVGVNALYDNTTGGTHTAVGFSALSNTIASGTFIGNTAVGSLALLNDTTGNGNVAVGWGAGLGLTTGSNNVYLGAGTTAGAAGESNRTYIRNVHDTTSSNRSVYVNPDGRMGTLSSSCRYKEEIKPMDQASEVRLPPETSHLSLQERN